MRIAPLILCKACLGTGSGPDGFEPCPVCEGAGVDPECRRGCMCRCEDEVGRFEVGPDGRAVIRIAGEEESREAP